ncbi:hypothetical protein ACI3LZ_000403, partial [Candidozyma auris]
NFEESDESSVNLLRRLPHEKSNTWDNCFAFLPPTIVGFSNGVLSELEPRIFKSFVDDIQKWEKEDYENANKLKNMLHDVKYALVSN